MKGIPLTLAKIKVVNILTSQNDPLSLSLSPSHISNTWFQPKLFHLIGMWKVWSSALEVTAFSNAHSYSHIYCVLYIHILILLFTVDKLQLSFTVQLLSASKHQLTLQLISYFSTESSKSDCCHSLRTRGHVKNKINYLRRFNLKCVACFHLSHLNWQFNCFQCLHTYWKFNCLQGWNFKWFQWLLHFKPFQCFSLNWHWFKYFSLIRKSHLKINILRHFILLTAFAPAIFH